MATELRQLIQILKNSAREIEEICNRDQVSLPSLDEPCDKASQALFTNEDYTRTASKLASAAFQLTALVLPPHIYAFQAACRHVSSACLRTAVEGNIAEALRDAGSEGLPVGTISARCGLPEGKLARVLRYLATHHIFREIRPNVFAHNRVSSILDTRKSLDDIHKASDAKHDGTDGFPALVELFSGDLHKTSAVLYENMKDALAGPSEEPNSAVMNRAFSTDSPQFLWYEQAEQAYRLRRFFVAMQATDFLEPTFDVLKSFNWSELPSGAVVVDVGGGAGATCLEIAAKFPHLHFIVQDRQQVIAEAQKVPLPTHASIQFQAHNFFEPQDIQKPSVFLLKHILHCFSDSYATKILRHLREAAGSHTQLLVVDSVLPYACHSNTPSLHPPIPPPLLCNLGPVNDIAYISDITMMLNLNSLERTLPQIEMLLTSTGWKFVEVTKVATTSFLCPVRALPA